jgi:hypothetical protein
MADAFIMLNKTGLRRFPDCAILFVCTMKRSEAHSSGTRLLRGVLDRTGGVAGVLDRLGNGAGDTFQILLLRNGIGIGHRLIDGFDGFLDAKDLLE